jgi:hypothetical protein
VIAGVQVDTLESQGKESAMRKLAVLLLILAMAAVANATNAVSLGYSDQGTTIGSGPDACAWGTLYYHHDGQFENAYAWQYGGTVAPYYGAFGEGFSDYSEVDCVALWVSTLPGWFHGQTCDVYVWADGVNGRPPGAVLGMVSGIVLSNVPNWPWVGENDISMNIYTFPYCDFTVGYWGNWPGAFAAYWCGADQNGFGGNPWTYIAPGIGYPTGWQDPSIIWGPTQSMGCGGYFGPCMSPVEAQSWGTIKALFE